MKQGIRIAVIGTYPPQRDGIGLYTKRYVDELVRQGHEVKVFSFKGNEDGGEVIGCLSRNNPFSYLSTALKIRSFNPEKILIQYEYVHYNVFCFPFLLLFLKIFGFKINLMMHTIAPYEQGWKAWVFRAIHLSIFLFMDSVFLHTSVAKEKLLARTWIPPHIEVLPIAIPGPAGKWRIAQGRAELLCFGFIASDKGIDVACKAVEHLSRVHLTIAGVVSPYAMQKQHGYLEEIKKLCGGKKNITLLNRYASDMEKEGLFKKADFIVLPYRFIEQSAVLTEVWGHGKIPICSDLAAFREEIGESYGALFSAGSAEALRATILDLLSDPKRQQKILYNIQRLVKKRGFAASAKELVRRLA